MGGEEAGTYVSLAVVNASEKEDALPTYDVAGGPVGKKVRVFTVTAPSVGATNTQGKQEVGVEENVYDGLDGYRLPKASFSLLRWKV